MLRIGSLFSGIGGLDIGLERAGLGRTVWQVEADPYCRAVLAKHWPDAVRYDDVRTVGAHNLSPVDVICGGFPCQDLSYAGKGAGLDGARSGLWFEYLRIVREVRPRVVIVENVAALRTRGLPVVLAGLEAAGYRAEWALAAARDVGAPHKRQRLFVVAVADADGVDDRSRRLPVGARKEVAVFAERRADGGEPVDDGELAVERGGSPARRPMADPVREHLFDERGEQQRRVPDRQGAPPAAVGGEDVADAVSERGRGGTADREHAADAGQPPAGPHRRKTRPAEPGVGRGSDGLRPWLDRIAARGDRWPAPPGPTQAPWEPPRTAAGVNKRANRLKALGNAVVPQVAEAVGLWALDVMGRDPA
jgi:DNA (cytosine-5)-methyltransferase 1